MAELGEKSALAKPIEGAKKGKVKVSVRDICTGARIEDATVVVEGQKKQTDSQGEVIVDELSMGTADITVSKHFKEADYIKFITHRPAIIRSYEAKSSEKDLALVEGGETAKVRVEIPVYKVVETVLFSRIHLRFRPELEYGHWWIEVGEKSYGWWPEEGHLGAKEMEEPLPPPPLSKNAGIVAKLMHKVETAHYAAKKARYTANYKAAGQYAQAIGKTFAGVPGILNGSEYQKKIERDPHHGGMDDGKTDEDYRPVIVDCRTRSDIHKAIRDFSFAYSGDWSWRFEFGRNCHTFQKDAMKQLALAMVKKL